MARIVRITEFGPPEVMRIEEVEVETPGPGEALVRQTVIGLNFVEVYFRRGTFPLTTLPATLGNEAAGVVEAVGEGVTEVEVGDRVVYADGPLGAYATERLYPADRLVVIPDVISDEEAAGSFLKGTTARYLVKEVVTLTPGDTVLFHAAAGGVGRLFSQWARSLGIRVIGTVSNAGKATAALEAGCVEVIVSRTEDVPQRVRELTAGQGVKAVFDAVGKDTFRDSLASLAARGTLVAFGKASGDPPAIDPFALAPQSLYLTWPVLPVYTHSRRELVDAATDLFSAMASGALDGTPTRSYAFDDIVTAHRDLEGRHTTGAAVIHV